MISPQTRQPLQGQGRVGSVSRRLVGESPGRWRVRDVCMRVAGAQAGDVSERINLGRRPRRRLQQSYFLVVLDPIDLVLQLPVGNSADLVCLLCLLREMAQPSGFQCSIVRLRRCWCPVQTGASYDSQSMLSLSLRACCPRWGHSQKGMAVFWLSAAGPGLGTLWRRPFRTDRPCQFFIFLAPTAQAIGRVLWFSLPDVDNLT